MIKDQKSISMNVSDDFILCTERKGNIFGDQVKVISLPSGKSFENFETREKRHTYKFKSEITADFFFETVNSVMDYQDALRNCIAPIDYAHANNPDDNWVKSSLHIGQYLVRKNQDHLPKYNRNKELKKMRDLRGFVVLSPNPRHIVLDIAQIEKNGIFYVYNLLIDPTSIASGYNPNGLASVEITGFVSESDAEYYAQSSQLFKDITKSESFTYNKYQAINEKRIKMFNEIMSGLKTNTKGN